MIISLLNQKGGVGKTTLSVNLAAAFVDRGLKTLLVDADPQGSTSEWSAERDEPLCPVIGMAKASLHKELPDMASDYDVTIIDGPPRVYDIARSVIWVSNTILIPVQPSPVDVWATETVVGLVKDAQLQKEQIGAEPIEAQFVINRKIANTVIGRDARTAFEDHPFAVSPHAITQRVIFAECFAGGMTVIETAPNSEAADEIRGLANSLIKPKRGKRHEQKS